MYIFECMCNFEIASEEGHTEDKSQESLQSTWSEQVSADRQHVGGASSILLHYVPCCRLFLTDFKVCSCTIKSGIAFRKTVWDSCSESTVQISLSDSRSSSLSSNLCFPLSCFSDGSISYGELALAFKGHDIDMAKTETKQLIKEYDSEGYGSLNYDDFVSLWVEFYWNVLNQNAKFESINRNIMSHIYTVSSHLATRNCIQWSNQQHQQCNRN